MYKISLRAPGLYKSEATDHEQQNYKEKETWQWAYTKVSLGISGKAFQ